jgi:integrase
MSIYRKKYRDESGKVRRAERYTAEFVFRGQLYRRAGFVDRDHAQHWVAEQSLLLRRGETGYTKPMLKAPVVPLIEAFAAHLRTNGRDAKYVETAENRLKRLAGECGWVTLAHVTAASLEAWKAQTTRQDGHLKQESGGRTKNQFVAVAKQWGKWLVKPAMRLPANPLASAEAMTVKHNEAYRRSGTVEELDKVLAACDPSRRLYYLCRLYTPMRGGTYGRLTWRMANLDATPPFFATPAEINKSRKPEKHTVRYEIAQELRAERKRTKAKADDLVFPHPPTLRHFKADLSAAGVAFDDGKGNRRLDFHAFRRTLIRLGKRAGMPRDDVSLLLGHKDPRTTAKYYDEDTVNPELGAMVEKLPALGKMRRAQ